MASQVGPASGGVEIDIPGFSLFRDWLGHIQRHCASATYVGESFNVLFTVELKFM